MGTEDGNSLANLFIKRVRMVESGNMFSAFGK